MPSAEPTWLTDDLWLAAHDGVKGARLIGDWPLGVGLAAGLLADWFPAGGWNCATANCSGRRLSCRPIPHCVRCWSRWRLRSRPPLARSGERRPTGISWNRSVQRRRHHPGSWTLPPEDQENRIRPSSYASSVAIAQAMTAIVRHQLAVHPGREGLVLDQVFIEGVHPFGPCRRSHARRVEDKRRPGRDRSVPVAPRTPTGSSGCHAAAHRNGTGAPIWVVNGHRLGVDPTPKGDAVYRPS